MGEDKVKELRDMKKRSRAGGGAERVEVPSAPHAIRPRRELPGGCITGPRSHVGASSPSLAAPSAGRSKDRPLVRRDLDGARAGLAKERGGAFIGAK